MLYTVFKMYWFVLVVKSPTFSELSLWFTFMILGPSQLTCSLMLDKGQKTETNENTSPETEKIRTQHNLLKKWSIKIFNKSKFLFNFNLNVIHFIDLFLVWIHFCTLHFFFFFFNHNLLFKLKFLAQLRLHTKLDLGEGNYFPKLKRSDLTALADSPNLRARS